MRFRIRAVPREESVPLTLTPAGVRVLTRPARILDFDIENRPLSYLGSDFTTAEVTAVAWAWVHAPTKVTVYLLGETPLLDILEAFRFVYGQADMVVGHYIRGHDLPMVNGALVELGRPVLSDKMTHDTKLDFVRTKGISLSQESLGAMLRLDHQKVQMDQAKWRAANRLMPEGLAEVRTRVTGDVTQHIEMREELLTHGYLGPPKMWRSGTAKAEQYTP